MAEEMGDTNPPVTPMIARGDQMVVPQPSKVTYGTADFNAGGSRWRDCWATDCGPRAQGTTREPRSSTVDQPGVAPARRERSTVIGCGVCGCGGTLSWDEW
ncbi:hypothetical protein GCM10017674_60160 [Streptomyces gardneri]|uniref:Uncharacterized protein n=1 Tax=Streptomyces gardneri TaxID=66892 RepID=A0A4Y3RKQ8_9ACTN|nr:hypothetical protein SGA01_29080 [Streptomyces gardneri]GHH13190.1 hypothetical protein GCM10017674_60160 [Streptomyces gardneri]